MPGESTEQEEIIPLDVQKFFDQYRESKTRLNEIVKQMERVLEKWSIKQQIPNEVPTLEPLSLTYPYKFADALQRVHYITAQTPGVLNEVIKATESVLIDTAALERQNLVKLYQSVVEKIFKAYLVNEVPVIDRAVHETREMASGLIKALEKAKTHPNERHAEILAERRNRFDFCLIKMRQHIAAFPEQQRKFADAIREFTRGLRVHYEKVRLSIDATLELLEDQAESQGQRQHMLGEQK